MPMSTGHSAWLASHREVLPSSERLNPSESVAAEDVNRGCVVLARSQEDVSCPAFTELLGDRWFARHGSSRRVDDRPRVSS